MSPEMNAADWALTLELLRACLPVRGARAKDDRLCLQALHHCTIHNITWRALPERFGNGRSIWQRFDGLGKAGVFGDFFAMLAGLRGMGHPVQMCDSTVIRAHVLCRRSEGGPAGRARGRSRGGFGTGISLKTDRDGLPIALKLTGGEASDSPMVVEALIDAGAHHAPRAVVADNVTDGGGLCDANRVMARKRGAIPVIPRR